MHHAVMAVVAAAATIDSALGDAAAAAAAAAAGGGGGGMNAVATMAAMVAVASDVTAVHQPLRTKACRCRRRRQN